MRKPLGPARSPDTRVRINPAGKLKALAKLMGTPLLGPPELGHAAKRIVGSAADWSSNGATKVLYEIPDPTDWERMRSGEWGPVSPKMTPTQAHYEGDVYVLDDWAWDNVAFVPKGAFPNAGVKSICVGDPRLCGFPTPVAAGTAARFDSMRPTVGDLVGYRLGEYPQPEPRFLSFSEAVRASLTPNGAGHFDPRKPTIGSLVGVRLGASQASAEAASTANENSTARFDPMRPTIGDLVGINAVEAAASEPPVTRRIDGAFDPMQATIGDLTVRDHTSWGGPPAGLQKTERLRSPFLTF